jgi:hypothetical protein
MAIPSFQRCPPIPTRTSSKRWIEYARTQAEIEDKIEKLNDPQLEMFIRQATNEKKALIKRVQRRRDNHWKREAYKADKDDKAGKNDPEAEELKRKLEKAQATINRVTAELISERLVSKHRLDDDELKGRWQNLDYKVMQIASVRYRCHRETLECERFIAHAFEGFVDRPDEWLRSNRRPYLFRAFIWNELVQKVFGERGTLWSWPTKARIATRRLFEHLTSTFSRRNCNANMVR